MGIEQKIFGFLNSQKIENNNIVVDEKYLRHLLTFENNPSDVNHVVLTLFNTINEDDNASEKRNLPPEIEEKINFNNVVVYRPLIENNYSENGFYLDTAYEALDSDTPGRRKTFLRYLNFLYLTVLGEHLKKQAPLGKLEIIRANADNIIVEVINSLLLRIASNRRAIEHISSESIEYNVIAIVCHAFVDCKVLENPNNQ
jgi:hypothetical protein